MVQKGLKTVPAEPIRLALEGWIERAEGVHEDRRNNFDNVGGKFTGLQQAVFAIFKKDRSQEGVEAGERIIWRLLDRRDGRGPERTRRGRDGKIITVSGQPHRQENITFDLADKILCALELQDLWLTDPELSAAYQAVDMTAIDLTKPTSEVTAQKADDLIWEKYLEHGSISRTRVELGLSHSFLKEKVAELRKQRTERPEPRPPLDGRALAAKRWAAEAA